MGAALDVTDARFNTLLSQTSVACSYLTSLNPQYPVRSARDLQVEGALTLAPGGSAIIKLTAGADGTLNFAAPTSTIAQLKADGTLLLAALSATSVQADTLRSETSLACSYLKSLDPALYPVRAIGNFQVEGGSLTIATTSSAAVRATIAVNTSGDFVISQKDTAVARIVGGKFGVGVATPFSTIHSGGDLKAEGALYLGGPKWRFLPDGAYLSIGSIQADGTYLANLKLGLDGSTTIVGGVSVLGNSGSTTTPVAATPAALPFYADDTAARAAGLPRWALYRYGMTPTSFRMRQNSEVAEYSYTCATQYYQILTTVLAEYTVEFWMYTPRLFGARLVDILDVTNYASQFSVGVNGGGFIETVGLNGAPMPDDVPSAQPNTNTWTHVAAVRSGGAVLLYLAGKLIYRVRAPPLSSFNGTVRITFGGQLGQTGASGTVMLSNVRVTNTALYGTESTAASTITPDFPLEKTANTAALARGSPPTNCNGLPFALANTTGGGYVSVNPITITLGSYIP